MLDEVSLVYIWITTFYWTLLMTNTSLEVEVFLPNRGIMKPNAGTFYFFIYGNSLNFIVFIFPLYSNHINLYYYCSNWDSTLSSLHCELYYKTQLSYFWSKEFYWFQEILLINLKVFSFIRCVFGIILVQYSMTHVY